MTGRCEAWDNLPNGCVMESAFRCADCGKEVCRGHVNKCNWCDDRFCECCIDTHEVNCEMKRKRPQSERLRVLRQKKA